MKPNRKYISPTAIATASKCLHSWYLECFGDLSEIRKPDVGTLLIFQRGIEYEKKCIGSLAEVADPCWDGKDLQAGFQSTVKLMREGRPWISGAILLNGLTLGFPDLLKREAGASSLGKHTYIPIEVKQHKAVTDKDRYQLLGYANLLESVLGIRPDWGGVWLNTGEVEEVRLSHLFDKFEELLQDMNLVWRGGLVTEGLRCGECATCDWIDFCFDTWKEEESICLLYGVSGQTARKLTKSGFHSWRDVANSTPPDLASGLNTSVERARVLWLHARAYAKGKPKIITLPDFPGGVPIYFYDVETYGDTVYLHGTIRIFGKEREEKQFLAKDPSQEKKAWHQFLNFLARDEKAIIYCWADYEKGLVNSLWKKYSGKREGWKHLEKNLFDQCKFVRDHFALPVHSYGIKTVAPLFGFSWAAEDASGLNSEAWYQEWLETGKEGALKKILRYNLDDVLAMEIIDHKLRKFVKRI